MLDNVVLVFVVFGVSACDSFARVRVSALVLMVAVYDYANVVIGGLGRVGGGWFLGGFGCVLFWCGV